MNAAERRNRIKADRHKIIWICIASGILYWITDSLIDVFLYHEGSLVTQIFTPSSHEIFMRLVTLCLFIATSFTVFSVAREKSISRALAENLGLYQALINQSNDSIEVIDPETGRFLNVNSKTSSELDYRQPRGTPVHESL